ncbi:hypothetical protein MRX96_052214, partial [Rhipicephalus microplus]
LQAVKQLCAAKSSKAGALSVLWTLLKKRALLWGRVWWTVPFSFGIPVACMLLLVLSEQYLLPRREQNGGAFVYEPERIFGVSYGFIESDSASKNFGDNVLLPLLSEHSVRAFAPTSKFVERELLFWAEKDLYSYLYEYKFGVSVFANSELFVWFNGQCPPSAVIGVNLLHTALLRNLTGSKNSSITLVNWPPLSDDLRAKAEFEGQYGMLAPKDVAILALFVANSFASLPLAYLFSKLFSEPSLAFSCMVLGLFLAGIVGSLGVEILDALVQEDPSAAATGVLFIWGYVCRWFPTYTLVRGVVKVILLSRLNAICLAGGELLAEACSDAQYSSDDRISGCCEALWQNTTASLVQPLQPFPETGFYEFLSMTAQGMLYIAVLALIDSRLLFSLKWYLARRLQGSEQPKELESGPRLVAVSMDADVEHEVNLVNKMCHTRDFDNVAIAVRSLEKIFGFVTPVKLVDGVSFLLRKGECLSVVGINGSGKTALLETLIGIRVPTNGDAYTSSLTLVTDIRGWQRGIGYAPDGVSKESMPALTVGEMLDIVARLRGVAQSRQAVASALALTGRLRDDQMVNECR